MRKHNIVDSIGQTPMVVIDRLCPNKNVKIFAKLEGQNTGGSASIKDRIARYMIEKAEESGQLTPNKTILEATSGNTGIALAMIGQRKGYKVKVVMPDTVSIERRQVLKLFGAEFVLVDGNVNEAIKITKEMAAQSDDYYVPDQFSNPLNTLAHYETTGIEILQDLPGVKVDYFIAGIGTGGTIMGVGKRLKENNPDMKIIGIEPAIHDQIQGLRNLDEGFIPSIIDLSLIDERVIVTSKQANSAAKRLLHEEGIFAGISAGASLYMALKKAEEIECGNIVLIVPDAGWKYLSVIEYLS
ncbi:MAG: cysteine synthase family protein [Chloroflexi bacterium]|nr:cysteine synthase family protein [Chloroflexota bacterium]